MSCLGGLGSPRPSRNDRLYQQQINNLKQLLAREQRERQEAQLLLHLALQRNALLVRN